MEKITMKTLTLFGILLAAFVGWFSPFVLQAAQALCDCDELPIHYIQLCMLGLMAVGMGVSICICWFVSKKPNLDKVDKSEA